MMSFIHRLLNRFSRLNRDFAFALCTVAASILSIVFSFMIAFHIFCTQQQDEIGQKISSNFNILKEELNIMESLDVMPTYNSTYRSSPGPSGSFPIGKYMKKIESWKDSPKGIFDERINDLKKYTGGIAFKGDILEHKFDGLRIKYPRYLLHLNDQTVYEFSDKIMRIFMKFYVELPSVESDGAKYFYQTWEFPKDKTKYVNWTHKFKLYYYEVDKVNESYLRLLTWTYAGALDSYLRLSKEELKSSVSWYGAWYGLDSIENKTKARLMFFESFMNCLNRINKHVLATDDLIKSYDRYEKKRLSIITVLSLLLSAFFGIVIPLYLLAKNEDEKLTSYGGLLAVTSAIGFLCFMLLAILIFTLS